MSVRKFLTRQEVSALLEAVLVGSHPERNHCLILMAFLHGFRASELLSLKLSSLDLRGNILHVTRMKNGFSTVHPLIHSEVKSIRRWLKVRLAIVKKAENEVGWLFITRNGTPLSRQQFYNIITRAGQQAGLPLLTHPHMLRHACGYALADNGLDTRLIQDYLGHRNIRHTVRYTASSAARFEGIWQPNRRKKKQQIDPKCKQRLYVISIT
ncbi:tyrosine-type recombinase/integrase [Salmonella enterica]|nr:tyrosine-type recombinase/integrase [Salmonella enterica]